MKTSIKIKKFWYAPVADDGGMGTDFQEIQIGQREATVQFNGSDAETNTHKNVLGSILESITTKGEKTVKFQFADLTPAVVADFTGGISSTDAEADSYDAPENENQAIEMSIMFLTDKDVLFRMARVSFDGYPMINDDDLHYYQVNGVLLLPEKVGVSSYGYDILKTPEANDIVSFTMDEQQAAATISTVAHTVTMEVVTGTSLAALVPHIGISKGASILPVSGLVQNFTSPVVYAVTSADGTSQNWTVTITVHI